MIGAKLNQLGDSMGTILFIASGSMSFFFSTLEEYYTGGLFLGVGNAISDGSVLLYTIYCYLGLFGNDAVLANAIPESGLWPGSPALSCQTLMLLGTIGITIGTTLLW